MRRHPELLLFGLGPGERSAKGLLLFFSMFFGAMVFAAITAPLVYAAIQTWNTNAPNDLTRYLSGKAFPDYFDRLRWLPVVIFLPALMRACGLWSWKALGLSWNRQSLTTAAKFAALGAVLIAFLGFAQLAFTNTAPSPSKQTVAAILNALLGALIGATLVAFLEEIVFRGLVFRIFYSFLRPITALLLASLFFAYVHFKMPDILWEETSREVNIGSGFFVAFWTLAGITQHFAALKFGILFFLGITLCLYYQRDHNLAAPIGLHAGVVFAMLAFNRLSDSPPHELRWFFGGDSMTDGILPLVAVGLLALQAIFVNRRSHPPDSEKNETGHDP